MYLSNQQRLGKYRSERRKEEIYDDEQQERLYEQLAIERGLDVQSTALAKLAKSVISKGANVLSAGAPAVSQAGVVKKSGFQILSDSIKAGKLDELVKSIIRIPNANLTKKQQIIKKDSQNPEIKNIFNENIREGVEAGASADELAKIAIENLGGLENKVEIEDMLEKAADNINNEIRNGKARGRLDTGQTKSISSGKSEAETVMTESTTFGGREIKWSYFQGLEFDKMLKEFNITEQKRKAYGVTDKRILKGLIWKDIKAAGDNFI